MTASLRGVDGAVEEGRVGSRDVEWNSARVAVVFRGEEEFAAR